MFLYLGRLNPIISTHKPFKLDLICVFEFQWLYRLSVEEVPEHDYMFPLSEAEVHYL